MYKVINNLENKIVFEGNQKELIQFGNKILLENDDNDNFAIHTAQDAIDYITEYCDNLNFENILTGYKNFNYGDKFKVKMLPLRVMPIIGIRYTSSTDEPQEVECTLEKYWEDDTLRGEFSPYKVKLKPISDEYPTTSYYWMDFEQSIKQGSIKKV